MRIAVWSVVSLAALNACAPHNSNRYFPQATAELTMSGALEQTVMHPRVNAGYAATIAGGRYSLWFQWPEEHPEAQRMPMSMSNGSPAFVFGTDSQPTVGTHLISRFYAGAAGAIDALMEGPHQNTSWSSDSGVLRITTSHRRTGTLAGDFDVWMQCTQRCPCNVKEGCEVRVRGSFAIP